MEEMVVDQHKTNWRMMTPHCDCDTQDKTIKFWH